MKNEGGRAGCRLDRKALSRDLRSACGLRDALPGRTPAAAPWPAPATMLAMSLPMGLHGVVAGGMAMLLPLRTVPLRPAPAIAGLVSVAGRLEEPHVAESGARAIGGRTRVAALVPARLGGGGPFVARPVPVP